LTTDRQADELNPVWSPDGRQIYFVKSKSFNSKYEIMVMDSDGRHQRSVSAQFPSSAWNPVLSPDGRSLVFFSNRGANYDIWSMETNGQNIQRLTTDENMDLFPTWGPDGQKVAFVSDRSGEIAVWTMGKDGGHQQQITAGGFGDLSPAWSPDGTRLAFIRRVRTAGSTEEYKIRTALETALDRFLDLPGRTHISHIWMKDFSTGQLRQLTVDDAEDGRPVWSPDGKRMLFTSNRNGNRDLYLMEMDSGVLHRLTSHPADDRYPSWSPDGTQIAFASNRSGSPDIWVMTLRIDALR
jgi:TolB protein